MQLSDKKCVPCEKWTPPLKGEVLKKYLSQLTHTWELVEEKKIKHPFQFKTFKESIDFVNKVANLAENENHHPNIFITFNKVVITLTTHNIGGLSENDFIMASKIEKILP